MFVRRPCRRRWDRRRFVGVDILSSLGFVCFEIHLESDDLCRLDFFKMGGNDFFEMSGANEHTFTAAFFMLTASFVAVAKGKSPAALAPVSVPFRSNTNA